MTFRARLRVVFLLAVIIPLVALSLVIGGEMTRRLTKQYERRVDALVGVIEDDIVLESRSIESSLETVREAALADNRLRRGVIDRAPEDRRYVLDYASNAMRLAGLDMLQLQDADGRILSSGHFRNEYDRLEPALPALLDSVEGGAALVQVRAADAPFIALARSERFQMGGRRFVMVGGVSVEDAFLRRLARNDELTVALIGTDSTAVDTTGAGAIVRDLGVPFIAGGRDGVTTARLRVTHSTAGLAALRRSINVWMVVVVLIASLLAVAVVEGLSARVSRPIRDLAEKTASVDLDRLDVEFDSSRRDEIGALSRLMGDMTRRLRASAQLIRDAERRATLGEVARQINHDIKNGLTPIRNVFRHLDEQSKLDAAQLGHVFDERRRTLDASISHLEQLATHYARLSRRGERVPCELGHVVENVVSGTQSPGGVTVEARITADVVVTGDPVALRRIIENLVTNAVDSCRAGGRVTVCCQRIERDGRALGEVVVADTGEGMTTEQLGRIFEDFYTTKEHGTGLGLSIVRRLVMDLDGSIRAESEPGTGSRFVVELPLITGGKPGEEGRTNG